MSESRLLHGDCMDRIPRLERVPGLVVVCDPPYGLVFMGRSWDKLELQREFPKRDPGFRRQENPADVERENVFGRTTRTSPEYVVGSGMQLWHEAWLQGCFDQLSPGGVIKAFSATRTYHQMARAMESVGFRNMRIEGWVYGSGFPKSHDISKAIDKAAGAERTKVRVPGRQARNPKSIQGGHGVEGGDRPWMQKARELGYHELDSDEAATPEAAAWSGWGTALKPAWEPVLVGTKP